MVTRCTVLACNALCGKNDKNQHHHMHLEVAETGHHHAAGQGR